jgi:hypothetical protein
MKKNRIILPISLIFCLCGSMSIAQNVGISNTGATPNTSAMLDVSATNKGVLITRVSLTSLTDVSTIANPATSLLVYNTNSGMTGGAIGFYYWNGTNWTRLQDSVSSSGGSWSTTGNNISNNNTGNVGIKTTTPQTPLHVTGQQAITVPNGSASTAHVTTLINDTAPASGTDSKIGLYSSVDNHATTNVGILTETISTNNANNYGVISMVSNDPGPTGSGTAIAAVDLVKSPDLRTFALKIDGKAQYAGVPNELETGTTLTNAGNGLMAWSKPSIFQFYNTIKDTIQVNQSKNVRFSNEAFYNTTGAYNSSTGALTITQQGFYHLTLNYRYFIKGPTTTRGITECYMLKNNVFLTGGSSNQRYIAHIKGAYSLFGNLVDIYTANVAGDVLTMTFSVDAYLNIGDVIKIIHVNGTDGVQEISLSDATFSGFVVR